MAPTVRSTGVIAASTAALTYSPPMPTGFVAGDLLIGIAGNGSGSAPTAQPSGSTAVLNLDDGTVYNMDIVRKVAVGGDVFTWTVGTASKWAGCVIAVTTGTYNPTTPLSTPAGTVVGTTSATLFTTAASTPASADTLMIAAFGLSISGTWSTTNTAPTMTEICDVATTATTPAALAVYRSDSPPAASSITRSATATVPSANGAHVLFFVNPGTAVAAPRMPRRSNPNFRR